jgi:hypothetical protein
MSFTSSKGGQTIFDSQVVQCTKLTECWNKPAGESVYHKLDTNAISIRRLGTKWLYYPKGGDGQPLQTSVEGCAGFAAPRNGGRAEFTVMACNGKVEISRDVAAGYFSFTQDSFTEPYGIERPDPGKLGLPDTTTRISIPVLR